MTIKINVKKDYILLESLSGVDVQELLNTLKDLYNLDQFKGRNVIWSFNEGPILLVPDDFERIFKCVRTKCLPQMKENKTALVAKPLFMNGLADSFIHRYRNQLPFKIKAFTDLQAAQNWISG